MADRTCSVDGCNRPHYAHDLCNPHYNRKCRTGDVRPDEPIMLVRPRGLYHDPEWCRARFEDDLLTFGEMAELAGCSIATIAKYVKQHGINVPTQRQRVELRGNGWPAGNEAGYQAVHDRVRAIRGLASEHMCCRCGRPARDWAYDNADPNEKRWVLNGRFYSTDPSHYQPMCIPCHRRFDYADKARRAERVAVPSGVAQCPRR